MIQKMEKHPSSWTERVNTVIKMARLCKAINRFKAIPIKLPMRLFTELKQIILKFIWNHKRKKEQSRRQNPPGLQTILQSYSNQNSVILAQKWTHRLMEKNREPRNKLTYLWSIFDKGGKNIKWGKASQQGMLGKLDSCL